MPDKVEVGRALREIGMLLELKGENRFRARAYEQGARAVEELREELGLLVDEQRLTQVRGIGEKLAAEIAELYATGRSTQLERLRGEVPPGSLELMRVPNLGFKKVVALHAALGIESIAALKAACEAGQVRGVAGFGEKTEQKILDGIRLLEGREERVLLVAALPVGEALLAHLRGHPAVARVELAGSLRRWRETVSDLDVVVATDEPAAVMDHFLAFGPITRTEARGPTKCTARLSSGLQVDLRALPPADFATALHHFTGSREHHVKLRGVARDNGLTISEWGVARLSGEKLAVADEAELYRHLGMQYIAPELREDHGEVEAALAGTLPVDLVQLADIKGLVHCHTTFSDGRGTVEEMARAAGE
jgi:DNA polymerase (family 10)